MEPSTQSHAPSLQSLFEADEDGALNESEPLRMRGLSLALNQKAHHSYTHTQPPFSLTDVCHGISPTRTLYRLRPSWAPTCWGLAYGRAQRRFCRSPEIPQGLPKPNMIAVQQGKWTISTNPCLRPSHTSMGRLWRLGKPTDEELVVSYSYRSRPSDFRLRRTPQLPAREVTNAVRPACTRLRRSPSDILSICASA